MVRRQKRPRWQDPKNYIWTKGYIIEDSTTNEKLQVFSGRWHFLNIHLAFPFIYKLDNPGQEWEYTSVSQGYHHQRALFARDYYAAAIISTNFEKSFSKVKVQNLNEVKWLVFEEEKNIMLNLLRASFSQTTFIRRRLMDTQGTRLVFAPQGKYTDTLWSCGVRYGDKANLANSGTWSGSNRLGVLLEQVREELAAIEKN